MSAHKADIVLVGGGLASSLTALRLKALRPQLDILILEKKPAGGDDHTWSFFTTDVDADIAKWLIPLSAAAWQGYEVRFPNMGRDLGTGYASLSESKLQETVSEVLGAGLMYGQAVADVRPDGVSFDDGRKIAAPLVIDGRGARPTATLSLAWQKFVGVQVRLSAPHGLTRPILMDATVPQIDGYRFLYVLPFDETTLLVEDTRYSDGASLAQDEVEREALSYAAACGWRVAEMIRREHGVLPIALGGDIDAFWNEENNGTPRIGMRAALFHPTTGYSLPDAARVADLIARAPVLESAAILRLVEDRSKMLWRKRAFFRALNRMLFMAAEPQARWRVLERFYRLPQPTIERFFAGAPTALDQMRTLIGKPPVPVAAALAAVANSTGDRNA